MWFQIQYLTRAAQTTSKATPAPLQTDCVQWDLWAGFVGLRQQQHEARLLAIMKMASTKKQIDISNLGLAFGGPDIPPHTHTTHNVTMSTEASPPL